MPTTLIESRCRCLAIFVVVGLAACYEEIDIATRRPQPGPVAIQDLRRVAIAPLQGQTGNTLATALSQALAQTNLTVVAPEQVQRALQRFGTRGLTHGDWARLARELHADAVFFGVVHHEAVDETFDAVADEKRFSTTYYRYVDTTLEGSIWAIDQHGRDLGGLSVDGTILHTPAGVRSAAGLHHEHDAMFDALFDMVDPQLYMAPAAQRLAHAFLDGLRPSAAQLAYVTLFNTGTQSHAQSALQLAQNEQWRGAAAAFEQDIRLARGLSACVMAGLYYNLGICRTQTGDTAQGRIALSRARSQSRACDRVDQRIAEALQAIDDVELAGAQAALVGWSDRAVW